MKFAHLGDCHLGCWHHPQLEELNLKNFAQALEICIKEKVDLILISGDLFDSAYPSIETLKGAFAEFKKLKDSDIPCYIIAGSHDYSASGKTFLDVLEKAGFCKNVFNAEEKDGKIILNPVIEKNFAIYGYPGKKSSLEIPDLQRIKFQDAPGMFKIFMLHTSIDDAIGNLPIESIAINELPKADYYALSHLHINYCKNNIVYSGPIFPANFQELEELKCGSFYIVDVSDIINCKKVELKPKEVLIVELEIKDTLTATDKIISELQEYNLKDKIILLKLKGILTRGKISDIKFSDIENFAAKNGAYIILKNTSQLKTEEAEIEIEVSDMDKIEENIIQDYTKKTPHKFNEKITQLLRALSIEKQEDEKNQVFQDRLIGELKKILNFE